MFYSAEALLLLRGMSFSSHSAVIAAYGKEFSKTRDLDPTFHTRLLTVQDYRNQGDYGHGPNVTAKQIRDALKWAEELIEAADLYLKNRDL